MAYLNEDGLARYDGLLKNWVTFKSGTVDGIEPLLNWQKTSTAGAVTCYPLPAAPIDPMVNFAFTEFGPASGTKSPDNPSTITGVTQAKVTRCGKNIIPFPYRYTSRTADGITWTVNDDRSITANGTATAATNFIVWAGGVMKIPRGVTYTLSGCPSTGSYDTYYMQCGDGFFDVGAGRTFSFSSGHAQYTIIVIKNGVTVDNVVFKPQLELGSTATSFEPYEGADYTIPLGGTYYGGSVDLSTGVMTVTWAHQTVTGGATNLTTIDASTLQFRFSVTSGNHVASDTTNLACNRFIPGSTLLTTGYASQLYYARIAKSLLDVSGAVDPSNPTDAEWLAAINSWLSSNNIEIAYKLATPYTVQLTPTQIYSLSQPDPYTPRINTVYSDQTSVKVGYPKSPLATSAELTNAIISLGSNL